MSNGYGEFVTHFPRSAEFINGMVEVNILAKKTIQMLEGFIQAETTTNRLNDLSHQFFLDQ